MYSDMLNYNALLNYSNLQEKLIVQKKQLWLIQLYNLGAAVSRFSSVPTLAERQRENLTERLKREFGLFLSDDEDQEKVRKQCKYYTNVYLHQIYSL